MAEVVITEENFDEKVLKSTKTVLLDFWATWCGPCKMLAPIIEEIAEEHPEITVGKVDVDEARNLAIQFGIQSIPTLIVMKQGKPVAQMIGYRPKEQILQLLK